MAANEIRQLSWEGRCDCVSPNLRLMLLGDSSIRISGQTSQSVVVTLSNVEDTNAKQWRMCVRKSLHHKFGSHRGGDTGLQWNTVCLFFHGHVQLQCLFLFVLPHFFRWRSTVTSDPLAMCLLKSTKEPQPHQGTIKIRTLGKMHQDSILHTRTNTNP